MAYTQNPTLKRGSEWTYGSLHFVVKEKDRHRIRRVEIKKIERQLEQH